MIPGRLLLSRLGPIIPNRLIPRWAPDPGGVPPSQCRQGLHRQHGLEDRHAASSSRNLAILHVVLPHFGFQLFGVLRDHHALLRQHVPEIHGKLLRRSALLHHQHPLQPVLRGLRRGWAVPLTPVKNKIGGYAGIFGIFGGALSFLIVNYSRMDSMPQVRYIFSCQLIFVVIWGGIEAV